MLAADNRLICVHKSAFVCMWCVCKNRERLGVSVGRTEVLTPSLFCPVLASISCRARTDRDCSNTKLQIHRSGGTYCRVEGKERRTREGETGEKQFEVEEAMTSCFKQKQSPLLGTKTMHQEFILLEIPWLYFCHPAAAPNFPDLQHSDFWEENAR